MCPCWVCPAGLEPLACSRAAAVRSPGEEGLAAAQRRALLGQPDQAAHSGCPVSPALLRHVDLPVGTGRRAQTLGALPGVALAPALGAATMAISRVSRGSRTPRTSGRSALLLGDCLLGGFRSSGLARGCRGEWGPQACRVLGALSSGGGGVLTSCHRRSSRARPGVPSTAAEPRRPEHGVLLVDPGGASALGARSRAQVLAAGCPHLGLGDSGARSSETS